MKKILLPLLALTGCTWVSDELVEGRLQELDDDGDGFTRDGGGDAAAIDCDDADAAIYPGAEDTWYDGVDSNCDGANDYDADVDGQDALDYGGSDCDDGDATIYDGAADSWYDGIDNDCAGDDDYDADLDGYQAAGYGVGSDDDCDDTEASINPGETETWYDGVDADCQEDSDYDADVDGQDALDYGGLDCDDGDATIYDGAADSWYDGIDNDCAGDDDYDADLDGYQAAGYGVGSDDDCDDQNPDAWPGNDEDLTDAENDLDCDGGATSAAIDVLAEPLLVGAEDLRLLEHDGELYLSLGFDEATFDGVTYADMAFALGVSDPTSGPDALTPWYSASRSGTEPRATGHELLSTELGFVGSVGGLPTAGGRKLSIRGYDPVKSSWFSASRTEGEVSSDFTDVAFGQDADGTFHAFGCDGVSGEFQYLKATSEDLQSSISSYAVRIEGVYAESCALWFYEDPFGVYGVLGFTDADTGEYVAWSFDPTAEPPEDFETPDMYFTEDSRDPLLSPEAIQYPAYMSQWTEVLLLSDRILLVQGTFSEEIVPAAAPVQAAIAEYGGTIYVAWADDTGAVGLAWGDMLTGFQTGSASLGFAATEAAPWISEDGTLLLVSAMSDAEMAWGAIPRPE